MYPQSLDPVAQVDFAFYFILGISIVLLAGITVVALYFVFRYHHTRNPVPEDISNNTAAEIAWTLIPTLIVMAMFYYGWTGFKALRTVPDNAMEVQVTGRMFSWSFEYENGKRSNTLYVPVGTPVKLNMTSVDVLHSFYVPAFRIKMDTVPGMDTYAWFYPKEKGAYDVLCAEYCGMKHANMITTVEVVEPDTFKEWLADRGGGQEKARKLFESYGCTACHSLDGSDGIAPTLKDIYGTLRVVVLPDGTEKEVEANEQYLEHAILYSLEEIVKGYEPVMPNYEGAIKQDDLDAMVGWMSGSIKTIAAGRDLMQQQGCISCHSTDGSIIAGPSFKDIWNRSTTVIRNGNEVEIEANEEYLVKAIREPMDDIVKGWDPIMPPYDHLSAEEVGQMLDYMKSLSDTEGQ